MKTMFQRHLPVPFSLVLLICAAGGKAAVPDAALLDAIPPDATIVYGIDVQKVLATHLGQQAYQRVLERSPAVGRFSAATGFDVKRDLQQLILVSDRSGVPQKPGHYRMAIARGTFRLDRFRSLAGVSGAEVTEKQGILLIRPPRITLNASIAFLDASTALIGDDATIRQAFERRVAAKQQQSPSPDTSLRQRIAVVSAQNEMWFATAGPLSELGIKSRSNVIPMLGDSVRHALGGVHLAAGSAQVIVEIGTASDTQAVALADSLRLAATAIKNPRLKSLQSAKIAAEGSSVKGTLPVPLADLESLVFRPLAK